MQTKSFSISIDKIDIFASLDSGQTFRFEKISDIEYVVYSLDKKAVVQKNDNEFLVISQDAEYFYKYFALDEDYEKITAALLKMPYVKDILSKNIPKLRILKQDAFEMIISFIISANNNIPRIKKIIKSLCESIGENIDGYFAFPSAQKMAKMPLEFYKSIGLGYRAEYILSTAQEIASGKFDVESLYNLDTNKAKEKLLSLKGVGPKVCDCILLFGYNKYDVFPVDTWIQKVYKDIFKKDENVNKMRKDFLDMFAPFAGIAQQYLFFAKRLNL